MISRWNDFQGAIERLGAIKKKSKDTTIRRYQAEAKDALNMSSSVFEKMVRANQLFRAYYRPYTDGRSSSYEIDDLIAHLNRLQDDKQIAKLYYYRYYEPKKFGVDVKKDKDGYPNAFDYVFKEGTYAPLLGGDYEG